MNLSTVLLKPGEADRLVAGHPWVYSSSILRLTAPAQDGDVVQVKDHRQRLLGVGFYNSRSKIAIRLLERDRVDINKDFFRRRLLAALEHRKRYLPQATSFRLVNAESDLLSGLIVDKYGDVLVLQTSSLGMDLRKPLIVDLLVELLSPRAILERNDMAGRKFEGLPESNSVLYGEVPSETVIQLNGLEFTADLAEGHKTGMYLDQQLNYAAVAGFARDAVVLDCFSFLGGFALHAARAGARHVHGLDQSEAAVATASRLATRNGVADRTEFEVANVFDWLKSKTSTGPNERLVPVYDVIILDPPSFTRNRASVEDALRGYKEIHLRALKLIKPGGILATFCCSHHVDRSLFEEVVLAAAYDTHRLLRRVASYSQSPDHPIIPAIPETEYLKGYAYEVLKTG
jgi:23S rRNA (cytosine1962-C5)-methyltransferase